MSPNKISQFMDIASQEAKKSKEPLKCGAVIIFNDKILSKAFNSQRLDFDITAHAEIKALRKAGQKLKSKNLNGATIISTCQPCQMCLEAIQFAKIPHVFYAVSLSALAKDVKFKTILKKTNKIITQEVLENLYKEI